MGNNQSYESQTTEQNKLGEGAYAIVYRWVKKETKELVAAKIYKTPLSTMMENEHKGYEREL